MSRIGVGITTRNRAKVLALSLLHFKEYWPKNHEVQFVVVEDDSTPETVESNKKLVQDFGGKYIQNSSRKGIAKGKNACLDALKKNDYIFLFDDDAFPCKDGWADLYIETSKKTGVHHFNHLVDNIGLAFLREKNGIREYENTGGVLLFLTKEALKKVGAFNSNFNIYGFEHADYTHRAHASGLHNGFGKYLTPVGTQEYIYSLDFNLNHWGILPKLGDFKKEEFVSSLAGEEDKIQGYIKENDVVFNTNWGLYRSL
jgi:glycosyltransferase involved in cell wall biosynthesis